MTGSKCKQCPACTPNRVTESLSNFGVTFSLSYYIPSSGALTHRRCRAYINAPIQAIAGFTLGANMQVTEIRIYPTNKNLVRAYVTITFDDCFMIREIKVIKGTTGYFVSMPSRKQRDGTRQAIAYAVNAETRNMIEQAVLAEYEKVVSDCDRDSQRQ